MTCLGAHVIAPRPIWGAWKWKGWEPNRSSEASVWSKGEQERGGYETWSSMWKEDFFSVSTNGVLRWGRVICFWGIWVPMQLDLWWLSGCKLAWRWRSLSSFPYWDVGKSSFRLACSWVVAVSTIQCPMLCAWSTDPSQSHAIVWYKLWPHQGLQVF